MQIEGNPYVNNPFKSTYLLSPHQTQKINKQHQDVQGFVGKEIQQPPFNNQ